ncbi:MAG: TlpA disulfide reductase family protein [Thermodesulfobacteriota bacterium]|nr:TlpA disulfide reductase family protein [Thermodesulfobacteriota bacterium]
MISKKFILTISGVLLLFFAVSLGLFDIPANKPKRIECVGEDMMVPNFTALDLKGEKINFADFRGKVILLDFWATWCPPCREEIPYFNELYSRYKKDGLEVIGVSLDRGSAGEVQEFLDKLGVKYVNLMGNDEVLKIFNNIPGMGSIQGIPTTFLIDRQGQICHRFVGLTAKRVLEDAIKPLLEGKI